MSKTYIYTANIASTEPLLPYIHTVSLPDGNAYRTAVANGDIQTLAGYHLDESDFDFTRDGDYVALGEGFQDAVMSALLETGAPDIPELYRQVKRAAEVMIEDALDEMEKDAAEEDAQ